MRYSEAHLIEVLHVFFALESVFKSFFAPSDFSLNISVQAVFQVIFNTTLQVLDIFVKNQLINIVFSITLPFGGRLSFLSRYSG